MGKKKLDININKLSNAIQNSQDWLLNSGIQNSSKKKKLFGSINAWYDPKKKKYSFVYSEINGYFLTLMVYLFKITKNKIYIERALKSAKWLINNAQNKNGGFKCLFIIDKTSPHIYKENLIYSFDNGVILNGLCSLYKITKKNFLIKSADRCAKWLMYSCVDKNFNVKPIYDIADNKFYDSDKEWSTTSGSYHTKVALGLANYAIIRNSNLAKKIANRICKKSLGYQLKDGRFVSFPFKGGTNAHPHCYSAEGLWSVGNEFRNKDYLISAFKAIKWILSKSNKSGLVPRLFLDNSKLIYNERLDVIAQVLRLNYIFVKVGKKNLITKKHLNQLINVLLSYQVNKKNDKKIHGSFLWGKKSTGEKVYHSNSWVTFFSLQCLYLIKDYLQGKKSNFENFDLV